MSGVTFNSALEMVDSLPEEQREALIEIVKNRMVEARREKLSKAIKQARKEYASGRIRRGGVESLLGELEG